VGEGDGEDAEEGVSVEEALTSTPKSTKLPLKPRTKTAKKKREEEETLLIQGRRRKRRSSSRDLGGRDAPHPGT